MRKILAFVFVVAFCVNALAHEEESGFSIQPKIGMNVSGLSNNYGKTRMGVAAGLELGYLFNPLFEVTVSGIYSQEGSKENKADYINVPVMAQVYVLKGLAVKVGVQPGFKVHDNIHVFDYINPLNGQSNHGSLRDINKGKSIYFSIPVGLSYEYHNVVLDAQYNVGCSNLMDDVESKHEVFLLTLGYKFKL